MWGGGDLTGVLRNHCVHISVCLCVCKSVGEFEQHSAFQVVLGRRDLSTLWTGRLSGVSAP